MPSGPEAGTLAPAEFPQDVKPKVNFGGIGRRFLGTPSPCRITARSPRAPLTFQRRLPPPTRSGMEFPVQSLPGRLRHGS
jgi:hypothetical protein